MVTAVRHPDPPNRTAAIVTAVPQPDPLTEREGFSRASVYVRMSFPGFSAAPGHWNHPADVECHEHHHHRQKDRVHEEHRGRGDEAHDAQNTCHHQFEYAAAIRE